jgi:hypothetical protein
MRLSLEDRIEADRIVCAMHVHLPSEIPWLTADEVLSVAPAGSTALELLRKYVEKHHGLKPEFPWAPTLENLFGKVESEITRRAMDAFCIQFASHLHPTLQTSCFKSIACKPQPV